jgi:flagellar biogenesis protein FliO
MSGSQWVAWRTLFLVYMSIWAPEYSFGSSVASGTAGLVGRSNMGGSTVETFGYVVMVGMALVALAVVIIRGGIWGLFPSATKAERKLIVCESRMVGARQQLMVVEYDGQRMLLGVSPGSIEYLCPLGDSVEPSTQAFPLAESGGEK